MITMLIRIFHLLYTMLYKIITNKLLSSYPLCTNFPFQFLLDIDIKQGFCYTTSHIVTPQNIIFLLYRANASTGI